MKHHLKIVRRFQAWEEHSSAIPLCPYDYTPFITRKFTPGLNDAKPGSHQHSLVLGQIIQGILGDRQTDFSLFRGRELLPILHQEVSGG